jgi:hypothetical protein
VPSVYVLPSASGHINATGGEVDDSGAELTVLLADASETVDGPDEVDVIPEAFSDMDVEPASDVAVLDTLELTSEAVSEMDVDPLSDVAVADTLELVPEAVSEVDIEPVSEVTVSDTVELMSEAGDVVDAVEESVGCDETELLRMLLRQSQNSI